MVMVYQSKIYVFLEKNEIFCLEEIIEFQLIVYKCFIMSIVGKG